MASLGKPADAPSCCGHRGPRCSNPVHGRPAVSVLSADSRIDDANTGNSNETFACLDLRAALREL
jgi:hypothetical protein